MNLALASATNTEIIVQTATDAGTHATRAAFGAFFYNVVKPSGEQYMLYTLSGVPRSAFEQFPMPRNTAVFAPTFNGDGVVRSPDITQDPRYGHNAPRKGMPDGHLPVRSYLAAPVKSRSGEVIGGLFFGHPEVGVFDEESERFAVGVAAQAAIAIDNARLYDQLRHANQERQALLENEQQARAAIERAGQLKDDFLATLSHELRTPLNAILGWTHILRRNADDPTVTARGIEVIERNARVQTQLIADLLDISRITSGKLRLDVQRVELPTVIDAALEVVRPAAEAKGVRLQSVIEPLGVTVHGDPNRLQQIIWNLVSNAVKFTPKGGRVQLVLARVNSHVEIRVSDTGEGIAAGVPAAHLRALHSSELFAGSRAHRSRSRFGARETARRNARRQGACGERRCRPRRDVRRRSAARDRAWAHEPLGVHPRTFTAPPDIHEGRLRGLRLLVVDDETDALEMTQRVLEEYGAEVVTVGSAAEGLALLDQQSFDVLISDIGMPRKDGYEFIGDVRRRGLRMPAAALTAFARSEDRTRVLLAGYQAHVTKPVEPAELLATIVSLTGRTVI